MLFLLTKSLVYVQYLISYLQVLSGFKFCKWSLAKKGCTLNNICVLSMLDVHCHFLPLGLMPDDPRGVIGESLQMWCSISSTSGIRSSDLELSFELITKRLIPVDARFIQIVNETTVEMNYLDLPITFNNAVVICRLKSSIVNQTETGNKLHDLQILQVGCKYAKEGQGCLKPS